MQLALDRRSGREAHDRILAAVASQAAASDGHFYLYGEGQRLARPVLMIARAGTLDASAWAAWCRAVAAPAPFKDWATAAQGQAGLARTHNLRQFFLALQFGISQSADAPVARDALPAVVEALGSLP